jgi:hypothetical protein
MRRALLTAFLLALAAPAAAAPADDLRALMEEHYRWLLEENPTSATALGVRDFDDRISDLSRRRASGGWRRRRLSSPGWTGSRLLS